MTNKELIKKAKEIGIGNSFIYNNNTYTVEFITKAVTTFQKQPILKPDEKPRPGSTIRIGWGI